ncbi:MAG: transcription antitermination factor NusB [Bacteroidetes bacterium]|nr:transcription antitermination factor NusB [Bacteroidota bacterium]
MLNRRLIRINIMKSLYSNFISKKTSYEIFIEKLKLISGNNYSNDLQLFDKIINNEKLNQEDRENKNFNQISNLIEELKKINNIEKEKLFEVLKFQEKAILYNYCFIINLIIEWKKISKSIFLKMKKFTTNDTEIIDTTNFFENEILVKIESSKYLNELCFKKTLNMSKYHKVFQEWYNEILKKDGGFINYCDNKVSEKEFLNHLITKVILKSKIINEYLSEIDPLWQLTNFIVKNMIIETINHFSSEDNDLDSFEIIKKEEADFFNTLIKGVLDKWDYLLNIFENKIKNWDLNRLFYIDTILIIMSAYEILFCKLPANISINEYIEISKIYSTPKSNKFINGVLDSFNKYLNENTVN